jgi:hypothetical protein
MISFRFHLVSLVGVFLALGIGIAVGASVVDRATVDALEDQVANVGERAERTNAENDRLRGELDRWQTFADQAGDELVEGRLAGVDVVVVGVQGIDRGPVDRLRQSMAAAGARIRGTVWLTGKLRLEEPADVASLSDVLVVAPGPADLVRRSLVERLAAAWATGAAAPLPELVERGFAEVEQPDPGVDVRLLASAGTRFVVVSDAGPDVPNEEMAVPLAAELGEQAALRVLAVEPGQEATGKEPAARAVFVGPLRSDDDTRARLSTVDNLENYRGRIAAVLALADFGAGKVGHYGVGPHASRSVPEPVT